MAITNASRLADFGSGIGTQGAIIQVDNAGQEVGIGTTNPNATLTVGNIGASGTSIYVHGDGRITGVLTATSFSGDGSSLSGVSVPGVSTTGHSVFNTINASGITTISATTSSTSTTTGALIVSGGVGIAKSLFVGEGVSVAGTITYDDVTNVDSIGIVTAGGGLYVGRTSIGVTATTAGHIIAAGVITATTFVGNVTGDLTGDINATTLDTTTSGAVVTGIVTASAGADLNGFKTEEGVYDTTALNGEFDFEFENGHVQTHTGSTAGTYFPDFRVSSSTSLNSVMGVGDVVSCTLIVAASNTAHYCTTGIKIDNSTSNVTIEWIGSSAASAGKGAGYDIYAFTIQKTAATPAYLVIVNATDAG